MKRLACCVAAWALTGCAAHTGIEPLPAGRLAPHVSFGGPIVEAFGSRVPIPYLAAGANYGLGHGLNLGANLHLLPLAYGVAGADAAVAWFPTRHRGWRPTLSLEARFLAFASMRGEAAERFLAYPVFSASAAWGAGAGLLYGGSNLALPLAPQDFDPDATRLIASPFVGYRWSLGERYALLTELKWHGVNVQTDQLAVSYLHPGGRGALTPLFALQRRF